MKKVARGIYWYNGIAFLFVGALHTFTHYQQLLTPSLKTMMDHGLKVNGESSNVWELWQGMSLMMGLSFIIIGLFNLSTILNIARENYPPINTTLTMILMCLFVTYSGYHFFSPIILGGGVFGLLLQIVCLFILLKNRK